MSEYRHACVLRRIAPAAFHPAARVSLQALLLTAIITAQTSPARAQATAEKAQAPSSVPNGSSSQRDLITRYRFSERYTASSNIPDDGSIAQYRVRMRDVLGSVPTLAKTGSPSKSEPAAPSLVQELVFSERPAEVNSLGQVRSLMRQYERVRLIDGNAPPKHTAQGLSLWYKPRAEELPQIVCRSENRQMRYDEYWLAAKQVFVPELANVLPTTAVRIGDTWPLNKMAMRLLTGVDKVLQGNMEGKFVDLRTGASGGALIAAFEIGGRVTVQVGVGIVQTALRAEIDFAFSPKVPAGRTRRPEGLTADEATVDARGAIVRLSMGQATSAVATGDNRKPQKTAQRQFIMERELVYASLMDIPRGTPEQTEGNTWLTYVDPENRFTFRHPQELFKPKELNMASAGSGPDKFDLIHWRPGSRIDHIMLDFSARELLKPEEVRSAVFAEWKQKGLDFLEGSTVKLDNWPGKQVHRFEAAIVSKGRSRNAIERIHVDGYVIQFLQPKATVVATAMTPEDPPLKFRRDVEAMLKSFRWGPPADEPPAVAQ